MTQAPEAPGPRHPWRLALAAALLATGLRLLFADHRGFWLDEYYTLHAARLPLDEMVRDRLAAGHSPLYFMYARLPTAFGWSEPVLRTTSALMIGATVLLGTGLLRTLGQQRALVPFWLIALALPYWFTIGIDYRYMSTLTAALMGAMWLAVRHQLEPSMGRALAAAAGVALLVWLHPSAIFPAAALLLHAVWEARSRGATGLEAFRRIWPASVGVLSAVPLMVMLGAASEGEGGSRGFPSFDGMLKNLSITLFGYYELWPRFLHFDDGLALAPVLVVMIGGWVLAWRALAGGDQGDVTARRLLASLIGGVPLILAVYTMVHKDVTGPERYVAAMSAPGIIALAIAWGAPAPRRLLLGWRVLLVMVLLVQAVASALERGDRNREGIRWMIPQVDPTREIVFLSTNRMNKLAFAHQGFPAPENLWGFEGTSRSRWELRRSIRIGFDRNDRGWFFIYHSRTERIIGEVLEELRAEGYLVDYRMWRLGRKVRLGALIRREEERPWLEAIVPPKPLWGPARSDSN